MSDPDPSIRTRDATMIHASALLVGATAVLVRGASGAGKSALVLDLLATLAAEGRFARLIGDDRVIVEARNGRVVVRHAPAIAGLIEQRGHGIVRIAFEPAGLVGLVVDLMDGEPSRLPERADQSVDLCGIAIRRIEVSGFGAPRTRSVLTAIDAEIMHSEQLP